MAEDEGECAVDVRNAISGESLSTFRLASSSRVLHVKRRVQGAHRISTFGQRLLLWPTGRLLEDHEVLATLPGPSASRGAQREPLAIMLVRLSYVDADAGLVRDLLHAAERGAADDLRRLLGLPMWPDYSNTGHLAAVLNPWGPFGTPLTLASCGGHPEAVRLLLDAGADKDRDGADRDDSHATLMHASHGGHLEVARLLLEARADGDRSGARSETPLSVASEAGHLEVARLLLEAGADADRAVRTGYTPLILASLGGHAEVSRLLLEAGAGKDKEDLYGYTPLMLASRGGLVNRASKGYLEAVRLLLAAGAEKDKAAQNGCTALILASREGQLDAARLLLKAGADRDMATRGGSTPLDFASRSRHPEMARLLTAGPGGRGRPEPPRHARASSRLVLTVGKDGPSAHRQVVFCHEFFVSNGRKSGHR